MKPKEHITLLCQRLDEMTLKSKDMIKRKCSQCLATVGILKSGQQVLKQHAAGNIRILCNRCGARAHFDEVRLAPGAKEEAIELHLRARRN